MLKGPGTNGQDAEKQFPATKQNLFEGAASLPYVKIPEIRHVDLLDFGINAKRGKFLPMVLLGLICNSSTMLSSSNFIC
jgi:hypothetical protein